MSRAARAHDARRYFSLPSPFAMKRGGQLHGAQIAYESWGQLNAARDNAVLVLTGLSPSAHMASSDADPSPGWWEAMVGPGKAIDTAEPVLAFTRSIAGETVLAVFNLAEEGIDIRLPTGLGKSKALDGHGLLHGHLDGDQLQLPGYGVWFASAECGVRSLAAAAVVSG